MAKTKAEIQHDYNKRTGYAANTKYNKEHTKMYALRVTIEKDADIIEMLEKQPSKSGYLKELIREDIKRKNNG